MPAVTLSGISFAGTIFDAENVRWAPNKVEPQPRKIGHLLEGPDGQRDWVHRSARTDYLLTWDQPVPTYTRDQVKNIFDITGTFTATLAGYGTVAVQCEENDYHVEHAQTLPDGREYWSVTLLLRQP